MATYHGGTGQPLDRYNNPDRSDTAIDTPQDFHPENTDTFENIEHINPTRLPETWMIYVRDFRLRRDNPQNIYSA